MLLENEAIDARKEERMINVSANDVLVMNPLLYSSLNKYIWIGFSDTEHKEAQRMFNCVIRMNIYIDGFVTKDSQLNGLMMYNKKILNVNDIEKKCSVIFCNLHSQCTNSCMEEGKQQIKIINPKIDKNNIVIWGAGNTGESAYKLFRNNGIEVKCFIDSNEELSGMTKCGLSVFMPQYLSCTANSVTVIEAMKQWEELDECIMNKYDKRFHYSLEGEIDNKFTCNIGGIVKTLFDLSDFYMFSRFIGKKIYIYGIGVAENEFAKYLKLMDFEFVGFLIDENDSIDDIGENEYAIKYVEEILYENNFYIWIYENKRGHRLRELGLRYFLEYECAIFDWDTVIDRTNPLDVNLGYNYYMPGNKYPGITIYGDDSCEYYKIAVLGSSTTDGALYPFRSWPELLYEELDKKVVIYNGGVTGYVSGQELLKLIRDILTIKPDMILVYDGGSDFYADERYPFAFSYAKTVYEYANEHLEDGFVKRANKSVCYGIESEKQKLFNWLLNIRSMYAIATERNLKFFSFFQPRLSTKRDKTVEEKSMLLSMPDNLKFLFNEELFDQDLIQTLNKTDYMYDLSHIFDGESDIYMDMWHVWEKGNRIIAKEIKKIIAPYLK